MEYILHKKQVEALKLIEKEPVCGYVGGIRSGKSVTGSHFAIKMIGERPNELGAIFSPTYPQLSQMTLKVFKEVLDSYGIFQDKHYVVNIHPKDKFGYESKFPSNHKGVWSFWNGAQVYTFSLESFYRGAEFGWGWGDEIQESIADDLHTVMGRMSGSSNPKTFYTYTPPRNNPDIDKITYGDNVDDAGTGTLPVIVGTTYDNSKNLPAEYIPMLESTYDPLTFQREVMCRRVTMVDFPWLYSFSRKVHVSGEAIYIPNEMVYVSLDFNNNPFVATLSHRGVKNGKRFIHYFNAVELTPSMVVNKTFIEAMGEAIWTRTPTQHKNNLYMVTGDATGRAQSIMVRVGENIWTELMRCMNIGTAQLRLSESNPLNSNARELCNAIFSNSEKPEGIEIRIHPSCTGLIRDCEQVQAKPDGTMVKDSRAKLEQRADWMDAMKYDLNAFNYDFLQR